jgi:hypothetical protein
MSDSIGVGRGRNVVVINQKMDLCSVCEGRRLEDEPTEPHRDVGALRLKGDARRRT